ncbi:MAG: DUF3781 domain-containing protein [Erysipelotrichales bacterium]|nr:DUF3781 domain-containing protein [Erysipelotrichales bacterium]
MEEYRNILINNLDKIHTTELGYQRIAKTMKLENEECIKKIKELINDCNAKVTKEGKNYYLLHNNLKVTINSYNYCVITAHNIKVK